MSERCADLSLSAGESLAATAVTAQVWLLVEVPGAWPRDVADEGGLPAAAEDAVGAWLADTPGSRLQFVRRPVRDAPGLAFVVRAEESEQQVRRFELDRLEDLASLDLAEAGDPIPHPLVLVCGHGTRDRCCALRGTAVFGELVGRLEEEQLWVSSHQGGHRFAANVLVLPAGLQFGRVDADEAPEVVSRALEGRITLDRYRGRTCYDRNTQAAELAVRVARGLDRVDDLRLARSDGVVRFRVSDGTECEAVVEELAGPPVPASCGAEPEPQRSFEARVL